MKKDGDVSGLSKIQSVFQPLTGLRGPCLKYFSRGYMRAEGDSRN